jgi:hypothetical protein
MRLSRKASAEVYGQVEKDVDRLGLRGSLGISLDGNGQGGAENRGIDSITEETTYDLGLLGLY